DMMIRMTRRSEAGSPGTAKPGPKKPPKNEPAPKTREAAPKKSAHKPAKREGEGELVDAGSLVRASVTGLADKNNRGYMAEETISYLREKCPGWDLYALHSDFEKWVAADPARLPAQWQKAFIGWVTRHHEKNRHNLR
ncbi:plasmid replication initiator protein, partial [Sphingomonadaceae bacterium]|nr:plasmid replication initiator protein [Sphingomonadaceae bacterium]